MVIINPTNGIEEKRRKEKKVYKRPAIIHAGIISTRAGSPQLQAAEDSGVDPADLFSNGK